MYDNDDAVYRVVRNAEEQHSIWPASEDLPPGWVPVGPTGSVDACVAYIASAWPDIRPLSLRDRLRTAESDAN